MCLVSIRGAITVEENTREAILEASTQLMEAMMTHNTLSKENLIQIYFTATKDLDAAYPAVAVRAFGITDVALMCVQEMYVVGSLEKCIRINILVDQLELNKQNVKHQYLKGATILRPDLRS